MSLANRIRRALRRLLGIRSPSLVAIGVERMPRGDEDIGVRSTAEQDTDHERVLP